MSLFPARRVAFIIGLLGLVVLSAPAYAQQTTAVSDSTARAAAEPARNALYVELGGAGLLYSINYDRHLVGRLHLRGGYATLMSDFLFNGRAHMVPVQLAFVSNTTHGLELGAGATLVRGNGPSGLRPHNTDDTSTSGIAASFVVGYRYQPIERGFLFRIGFTPFVGSNGRFVPSGGISFGYAF
ncbi:hypothetical protein [Longimonas halophila]|uniref:hypothetical protein n=1 Tax=Longimonas halophila TaxID=1469170 RepID=UPI00114161F4|nr:hypothetical protein [Longimonas halophila]